MMNLIDSGDVMYVLAFLICVMAGITKLGYMRQVKSRILKVLVVTRAILFIIVGVVYGLDALSLASMPVTGYILVGLFSLVGVNLIIYDSFVFSRGLK